jgi:hypothetical protein
LIPDAPPAGKSAPRSPTRFQVSSISVRVFAAPTVAASSADAAAVPSLAKS